jgi:cobalt-zinc-cadmium efflux system protein
MGAGHFHGLPGGDRAGDRRALAIAFALTATYTVAEIVGGWLTGSLALLADAGHMLSDNVSIALALFAVWIAAKPPTPERTYGFKRVEILVALANGATLVLVSLWIFYEAFQRFQDPPDVLGGWMLAIASVGLGVNLAAASILRSHGGNLNVQAAFRHVLADTLGSLGTILAGIVILTTGWEYADPLVGAAIGVLILLSSWTILRDSLRILLEETPAGIDAGEVGRRMAAAEGVVEVHDLHIWTITSGFASLSAHVLVRVGDDCHARRRELEAMLAREFGLEHTTLQVDHVGEHTGLQITQLEQRRG